MKYTLLTTLYIGFTISFAIYTGTGNWSLWFSGQFLSAMVYIAGTMKEGS